MPDQKLDNLLNLALDATEEEREKSRNLNVGYEKQTRKWEIIVKYSEVGNANAGNAGAIWLETACGSCSYVRSCSVDGAVFGTGPGTWTDHYLCTDRSRGSSVFPGAFGYA